jgi:hypothetical protein
VVVVQKAQPEEQVELVAVVMVQLEAPHLQDRLEPLIQAVAVVVEKTVRLHLVMQAVRVL